MATIFGAVLKSISEFTGSSVTDDVMFACFMRGLDSQYRKMISMLDIVKYDVACTKVLNLEAIDFEKNL